MNNSIWYEHKTNGKCAICSKIDCREHDCNQCCHALLDPRSGNQGLFMQGICTLNFPEVFPFIIITTYHGWNCKAFKKGQNLWNIDFDEFKTKYISEGIYQAKFELIQKFVNSISKWLSHDIPEYTYKDGNIEYWIKEKAYWKEKLQENER